MPLHHNAITTPTLMQIKEVIAFLESIAPPSYQENYDNAGLIVGSPQWELNGTILCLDSTEEVV